MKTFLLNLNNWALSFECETWEQAMACADDIGAELLGEFVEAVDADFNVERLLN